MKCGEMSDNGSGWLHLATHALLDVLDFKEMRGPPSLPPSLLSIQLMSDSPCWLVTALDYGLI